ncbi:MAG: succinylglutamate desuccinylase/aspartoacylase family protein [Kiritimatiellae bacterium]|nr:succinylglutamate desuccinylase/aspartoacylase family protein [Kiritimatiellia bacterium]
MTAKSRRRVAGKQRTFLETATFAQGVKARLPVLTVTGARRGPSALIVACQHGRELNGIAAIARAFDALRPASLRGNVVFVPVMNPLGVRIHAQDFPVEQPRYRPTGIASSLYNINRKWRPEAAADSTYAAEVAACVWREFGRHADVCLDLHGWNENSLSLAWAPRRHLALLRAFGFPWHMVAANPDPRSGMLEYAAFRAHIPYIITELSPQNTIAAPIVTRAAACIRNLLIATGMLEGEPDLPESQCEFDHDHVEVELRTTAEGLLVSDFRQGDTVRKGDVVARVLSLETLLPVWEYRADREALIFNLGGGGPFWGEDCQSSAVVHPGQIVGLLKVPSRIVRRRRRAGARTYTIR